MVTKVFAASAAIVLLGILSEVSGQYRPDEYGHGYEHHQSNQPYQRPSYGGFGGYRPSPQQNNYQLPPAVSVQDAEWVCTNPSTGDMLIISSEDLPAFTGNNGQPQPQHPNPNNPFLPTFPPINSQSTFPQPPPIYLTPSTPQPSTEAPNTNGDGLIDIRALK